MLGSSLSLPKLANMHHSLLWLVHLRVTFLQTLVHKECQPHPFILIISHTQMQPHCSRAHLLYEIGVMSKKMSTFSTTFRILHISIFNEIALLQIPTFIILKPLQRAAFSSARYQTCICDFGHTKNVQCSFLISIMICPWLPSLVYWKSCFWFCLE